MRAMILAAGRGERLRPLTDRVPKPLVVVQGQPLIFHHLQRLASAGFNEIVVNLSHLGGLLKEAVGDGSRWGMNVHFSEEPVDALETGGGIAHALPLLGMAPFAVVNGDIFTDYPFERLRAVKCSGAHLVLVPVPEYRTKGDFALQRGRVFNDGDESFTFSGICVYHPAFFSGCPGGRWSIVPHLKAAVQDDFVSGELYRGRWHDVGTPERLVELQKRYGGAH